VATVVSDRAGATVFNGFGVLSRSEPTDSLAAGHGRRSACSRTTPCSTAVRGGERRGTVLALAYPQEITGGADGERLIPSR
jgi:hypothetical protein